MIGSDIPGDSRIRDQNTNGPLSQRWQPVVRVYKLVVISTNLMNQIAAIHCSPSPSLMAYTVSTALELKGMKAEGQRRAVVFERVRRKKERKKYRERDWKCAPFFFRTKVGNGRQSSGCFRQRSPRYLSVQRLSRRCHRNKSNCRIS